MNADERTLRVSRRAAVAGTFYPQARRDLSASVDAMLADARAKNATSATSSAMPKAIIVPHAGYVYSGPIAARAFALLAPFAASITRAIVLGPAHRAYVDGVVSAGASRFETPLGAIDVDVDALARIPEVVADARAHAQEHSIEVELPFLQKVAPRAKIVPLALGRASPAHVARVI